MDTRRALELALASGMDLAEISPTSNPPVCKILDYGKFKYEQKKKAKQSKRNQVVTQLKEVQFRPNTDTHDIEFKTKHILRFLAEGNKVKVSVRFRGREASHAQLGYVLVKQIVELIGPAGIVEANPKMEGKILSLIVTPGKAGSPVRKTPRPEETKAPAAMPPSKAASPAPAPARAGAEGAGKS